MLSPRFRCTKEPTNRFPFGLFFVKIVVILGPGTFLGTGMVWLVVTLFSFGWPWGVFVVFLFGLFFFLLLFLFFSLYSIKFFPHKKNNLQSPHLGSYFLKILWSISLSHSALEWNWFSSLHLLVCFLCPFDHLIFDLCLQYIVRVCVFSLVYLVFILIHIYYTIWCSCVEKSKIHLYSLVQLYPYPFIYWEPNPPMALGCSRTENLPLLIPDYRCWHFFSATIGSFLSNVLRSFTSPPVAFSYVSSSSSLTSSSIFSYSYTWAFFLA